MRGLYRMRDLHFPRGRLAPAPDRPTCAHLLVVTIVEWQQKMVESPVGHAPALLATHEVRGSKMNSQVDARIHHVLRGFRKTVVGARLFHRRWGESGDVESHLVRTKEQLERACR